MQPTNKDTPPNRLIHSASPYLLQHAYNPVDWHPWSPEALEKARNQDKPILVSIGYSACHWCHVMERECFENEELATLMNRYFVCIKVDREERPDVDAIYMEAVQAMGQNGGWPLNVFLTPDQKPFYGGTYFPPQNWRQVLLNLGKAFRERRQEVETSAEELTGMLQVSELKKYLADATTTAIQKEDISVMIDKMEARFDAEEGGMARAPKFPMPSIWRFLLRAHGLTTDARAMDMTHLTLTKMADGGLYDQVGGGFARYSVDDRWFAPHFEKMLYDNGQLLSLYAEAYRWQPHPRYQEVMEETIAWALREMHHPKGGFYAALDADSEGIEGKFYCWTKEEWKNTLGEAPLLWEYWNLTDDGNWEHGRNILHKSMPDQAFSLKKGIALDMLQKNVSGAKKQLLEGRFARIRPGLDHKVLAGWNGMMIRGLTDAGLALENEEYLSLAVATARFLDTEMTHFSEETPTLLYRTWQKDTPDLLGTLEDYAFTIDGYLALHQATQDTHWFTRAHQLTQICLQHFFDPSEGMFFYTDARAEALIARKKELFDNVIPSTNAVMAHNLLVLGKLCYEDTYHATALAMLEKVRPLMVQEPAYLAHWGLTAVALLQGMPEVVIVGPKSQEMAKALHRHFRPGVVMALADAEETVPMTAGKKAVNGRTTLYVCHNKACRQPVHTVEEAMKEIMRY
jgi:uncharacterized protein